MIGLSRGVKSKLRSTAEGASLVFLAILTVLILDAPVDAAPGAPSLLPLEPAGKLIYSVNRGTGMSIDVSPDGKTIAFDMLGDIYVLPAGGGTARRFTSGMAWDAFPRFSPDGRSIAFVSDSSGLENIWTMSVDGSSLRQVSRNAAALDEKTPFSMRAPIWTDNGRAIAVRRKQLRNPYSADELWLYDVESGEGSALVGRGRPVDEVAGPTGAAFSRDGRGLIYAAREPMNPEAKTTSLWYVDRRSMARSRLIETPALLSSPVLSPDGKTLAYLSAAQDGDGFGAIDLRTCSIELRPDASMACERDRLILANLGSQRASSAGWWTWPQLAVFTPDGRALIALQHGQPVLVGLHGGAPQPIAMRVDLTVEHAALNRSSARLDDGPLPVRQLSGLQADRGGARIVFGALGDIWLKSGDRPRARLGGGPRFRFDPALSPDGKHVAYAAWSDADGGSIWIHALADQFPVRVARSLTHAFQPRWSADGRTLLFLRDSEEKQIRPRSRQQLMAVSVLGGKVRALASGQSFNLGAGGFAPSPLVGLSGDGLYAYLTETRMPSSFGDRAASAFPRWRLLRIPLTGEGGAEPVADFYGLGVQALPSPDGRWLAIQHSYNLYLRPMPDAGEDQGAPPLIALAGDRVDPNLIRITNEGAADPLWSADGTKLSWSWGNRLYRGAVSDLASTGGGKRENWTIDLAAPPPAHGGKYLLGGGRVITMAEAGLREALGADGRLVATTDAGVLPCGDILVAGRRIEAVGPCGSLAVEATVPRRNMAGRVLMPGFIAMHEHRNFFHIPDEQPRDLSLMLAHGITTASDPGQGWEALRTQELIDAGRMKGPRWLGTLIYMFDADFYPHGQEIASAADARDAVRKYKLAGAAVLKDYMKASRLQRQWLSEAARRGGIRLTSDQGFQWDRHVTQVLDGYSGFEHALNTCDVGPDVTTLFGRLGVSYTPQLGLEETQAVRATAWLAAHPRPWWTGSEAERQNSPFNLTMRGSSSAPCRGAVARDLLRAGANVMFGRDNGLNGLEQHQALWGFSSGGMTNAEILRVGTINGARGLGLDRDLGSIEPGKIADILVLDADPLADIFNTLTIRQVIKDGSVYDGDTLGVVAADGAR